MPTQNSLLGKFINLVGDDILQVVNPGGKIIWGIDKNGGTYSVVSPDSIPVVTGSLDDEFNGLSFDTTRWTFFNQGGTTATVVKGSLILALPNNGNAQILRGILQPAPIAPWEVTAKISVAYTSNTDSTNSFGIALQESSAGKLVGHGFNLGATTPSIILPIVGANSWTNPTTIVGGLGGGINTLSLACYFRINNDGMNLRYYYSNDGINFILQVTRALTADFTVGPDHVGLCGNNFNATQTLVCDWFRRTL